MTEREACRLCVYLQHRHGYGICATPEPSSEDPDCYNVRVHLAGVPRYRVITVFRREPADKVIEQLWGQQFPEIPR